MKMIPGVRYRYESWIIGWAMLGDGLANIFTLGLWWPNWSFKVSCWANIRRMKRTIVK